MGAIIKVASESTRQRKHRAADTDVGDGRQQDEPAHRDQLAVLRPPLPLTHHPSNSWALAGFRAGGHLDEDVIRELAQILAAAFLRYQRVQKVREESEPESKNELDTSAAQSLHGQ